MQHKSCRRDIVSRPRVTQIMNLLNLAPDTQEAVLLSDHYNWPLTERDLRPMAAEPDWRKQRGMWKGVVDAAYIGRANAGLPLRSM